MRKTVLSILFVCLFGSGVQAADEQAVARATISSQLEAFARDDAPLAYSFAAPSIQEIFSQPEIFMRTVRNGYAPVYRHKSFEFGDARNEGSKIAQVVHILDQEGTPWEALYTLEQQVDGTWKISGCVLLKASDGAA